MTGKDVVFILGMSRTGTSALTRVLSLCGLELPGELVEPNYANPTGFWEPVTVVSMNEAFLRDHGSSWCDPAMRPLNEQILDSHESAAFIDKIVAFVSTSASDRPMLIKDPRIASLTPFWFEGVRRCGFQTKILIPVRHPFEVAASLAKRDGASPELSDTLWLKANFLAERSSRDLPRLFVEYSSLLTDWRAQVARIGAELHIDLSNHDEEVIDSFLDPELYTHQQTVRAPGIRTVPWLLQIYDAFSSAADDAPLDTESLNRSFNEFATCAGVFIAAEVEAKRITSTLGIFGGIQELDEREATVRALENRVDALTAEREILLEARQRETLEQAEMMSQVKQRLDQWSKSTLIPVTGPIVMQRETRGFEPDGWMLRTGTFECKTMDQISTVTFDGWSPGTEGQIAITARVGEKTERVELPAGQRFSFALAVDLKATQVVEVELAVQPAYYPARVLPDSLDDRELGLILQLVTFS
jgi:hypothetical protein